MCRRRRGCRDSRSGAGPLALDRCSRLCRCLHRRLRTEREKVGAELSLRPRGLRGLCWRLWIGSGGVSLVREFKGVVFRRAESLALGTCAE